MTKVYVLLYSTLMYIKREIETEFSKSLASPKVVMLLGARQVGKTTLVKELLKDDAVFFNLDLEIDKTTILSVSSLNPAEAIKKLGNHKVIIFDEAQRLPEIGTIVKGWHDSKLPNKIILTGSSSLNLLNQSAESLTGRNEKLFLPPLLFQEILASQNWYPNFLREKIVVDKFPKQVEAILMQSIIFGSYPEAVLSSDPQKLLLNLASDYLIKDILQEGLVKDPSLIRKLLMLLAHQIGAEVSINELAANLSTTRVTVDRYLNLLEQTFVIFRLPAFSSNPRKEISKNQKIYFWDTGIRNAILNDFSLNPLRPDIGALWEGWVVAEFAKQNLLTGQKNNLYFWRSKAGSEVDLLIKKSDLIKAYEIKWQKKFSNQKAFYKKYGLKVEVINKSKSIFRL